ncbi:MAG: hypothetical protein ACRENH_03715, partial [Gemmatimonadaceae bacterium]
MRQSSAPSPHEAPRRRSGPSISGDQREQWFLLYAGLIGAALLSGGLWFMRAWIARATTLELLAGALMLIGAGIALSAITAFTLFAARVDRVSEDVARALDAIAAGNLATQVNAPRGLGREARLAGAASAALARLRSWMDASRSALITVEQNLSSGRAPIPRLRDAVAQTTAQLGQLSRDARFQASSADEHGALTQRACVLASVIGQSRRDNAAFADSIHTAAHDAATTFADCVTRTADLRAAIGKVAEESDKYVDADRKLAEYLVVVAKSARQFKLMALHAAMEAARAGAQSEALGTKTEGGQGAEFRVVALEVRRMALDLAKHTEDITRTVDAARSSLLALHAAAAESGRRADSVKAALSLGVTALEHATAATSARRADDAALAEAGAELTILTSAIRERAAGASKGSGEIADRLMLLEQSLAAAEETAREIEQALSVVEFSTMRAKETVNALAGGSPTPTMPQPPSRVSAHMNR